MPVKPPSKGNTTVEVHTPPSRRANESLPGADPTRFSSPVIHHRERLGGSGRTQADIDLDAITPAPQVNISEIPSTTQNMPATRPSLEEYRIASDVQLPQPDAQGFRWFKGRQFVDMLDGSIFLVGLDSESGLYRARLSSERVPSGPLLLQDPDSRLWYPMLDPESMTFSLSSRRLEDFRTSLDFTDAVADDNGIYAFEGKRYVVIENQAYQVMQDIDASSPQQKVWRIVKPTDPVANDDTNIYNASRPGETLAISRGEANAWFAVSVGLKGGMHRRRGVQIPQVQHVGWEPFEAAHAAINQSTDVANALWVKAFALPVGSAERTLSFAELELLLFKHTRLHDDFAKRFIDHEDWKHQIKERFTTQSLQKIRMDRVVALNSLLQIMDLRIKPSVQAYNLDSYRKLIGHYNRKLKLLDIRQTVVDQIKQVAPRRSVELDEMNRSVHGADEVNCNKLIAYLYLFANNPENPAGTGMQSARAARLFSEDLENVPRREQPPALLLALDQIKAEKIRFEAQVASETPENTAHLREIIALTDLFEKRIESTLTEIFATFDRNTELPRLDQEIDFDFVPAQPVHAEAAPPPPPRKIFRTRQRGTYKVLVGEQEIAPDGNVTLKVPDPFHPNNLPQRYEKREGEWLPVRPPIGATTRLQLLGEANRLLAEVKTHQDEARAKETGKTNPTEIIEFLGTEADRLNEQARLLEHHSKGTEDREITGLVGRLRNAGNLLTAEGQKILIRMYKDRDVLDILRLNYLLDHAELGATRTVDRQPVGKGQNKSFLDVYSITDRSDGSPLWEAHFHYDRKNSVALNFTVKGAHLKKLDQARRGASSQRQDEQAGLPHVPIWRESFDGKTARKIFELAK
ncbi:MULTISPECIES: hypothetical protein [Pseudomonas fluorescens group]|uniref:hypothetical protein n=1 Tax=Pseudomonas fluorescens group TaxID=136843 RepID=UPI000A56E8DB|nr:MULTISPECIES: hypothetical protein [Pseudomonas fluorescens group]